MHAKTWNSAIASEVEFVFELINLGKIKSEWTAYSEKRMLLVIYKNEPFVCSIDPWIVGRQLYIVCSDTKGK